MNELIGKNVWITMQYEEGGTYKAKVIAIDGGMIKVQKERDNSVYWLSLASVREIGLA